MDCHVQTLPYDILATFADQLALDRDSEEPDSEEHLASIAALQAMSQTCKLMVPACRQHLFSSISLSGYEKVKCQNLLKLLQKNPEIASYVIELQYQLTSSRSKYEDGILEALLRYSTLAGISSPLSRISLTSSSYPEIGWSSHTATTRHLLISLIQLPTITELLFSAINEFPVNELALCGSLKRLQLRYLGDFALGVGNALPSRCRIPTPMSLDFSRTSYTSLAIIMGLEGPEKVSNTPRPIIDFSLIQEATLAICDPPGVVGVCKLLKTTRKLERLSIRVYDSPTLNATSLANLGPILAADTSSILKSINFQSDMGYQEETALWGFDRALQDMAGNSVLEELELCIKPSVYHADCMNSGKFENLDRVLTEHGAFPKLRRVSIKFTWQFPMSESEYWSDDEIDYRMSLDQVTGELFPRLYGDLAFGFSFHQGEEFHPH